MKTLLTKLSLLSLVLTLGLASCTEEEGTGTGGGANGVSELTANAQSSTAVNLRWKGGSATDTLIATLNGTEMPYTVVTTQDIDGVTYHRATATGLAMNNNYVFTVRNDAGTSGSITWSPAIHWPNETNNPAQTVQIWSTADNSPNDPSGLIIDADGITAVSVNGTRKNEIDLVLAHNADINKPVSLVSPGIDGSGLPDATNRTLFGEPFHVAGGLDNDFYDKPINNLIATGSNGINAVDLVRYTTGDERLGLPMIIPFLTSDQHYGRIEITPAATGQPFTTDANLIESIQVRVSYQTQTGEGYVNRGTVRSTVRNATSNANSKIKHY